MGPVRKIMFVRWGMLSLLFVANTLVPFTSLAGEETEADESIVEVEEIENDAEFPAKWLDQLLFAYNDFQEKQEVEISCFDVWIYQNEGMYYIAFVGNYGGYVVDGKIQVRGGTEELCGNSITYEFDEAGQFIRRIYSK